MSDHEQRELERLEATLKGLTPAAPALDRDRLLFRAGQATRRAGWRIGLWTALAGLLAGAGGTYAGLKAVGTPAARVEIVYIAVPTPAPPPAVAPKNDTPAAPARKEFTALGELPAWDWTGSLSGVGRYLQLRNQMLRWGVDSLPAALPPDAAKHQTGPANLLKLQADLIEETAGF